MEEMTDEEMAISYSTPSAQIGQRPITLKS